MNENSKLLTWYQNWPVQAFVATVWTLGLAFNVIWSTYPTPFRIVSGLACAGLAVTSGAQARRYWQRDREAARRRASAPDIERIP